MNYLDAVQAADEKAVAQPVAGEVERLTAEIQVYKQQAGACIVEIGRRLIRAKELLPHGAWAGWLEEKVEFSERSAQNFMRVAKEYSSNPQPVADLGIAKALLLLQVPEEEREAFIEQPHETADGEKTVAEMSKRELEKVIRERDEARSQIESAREDAVKWKNAADATEILLSNAKQKLEAAKEKEKSLSAEMSQYSADLQKAEQKKAAAEQEQKALAERVRELEEAAKAEPIPAEVMPDEETLAKIRAEVLAEQKEAIEAANARAAEAAAKLEKAKNPAALRVNLCFEDVQAKIAVIESALHELRGDQPEVADKFCDVIAEFLNQRALAIGG